MKNVLMITCIFVMILAMAGCSGLNNDGDTKKEQAEMTGEQTEAFININDKKTVPEFKNLTNVLPSENGVVFEFKKNGELLFEDIDIQRNNYFSLDLKTDQPLKGRVFYRLKDTQEEKAVEFFVLDGEDYQQFRMILDPFRQEESDRIFYKLELNSLKGKKATVDITGMDFTVKDNLEDFQYIDNGTVKVGVNLEWGGGIGYLEYMQDDVAQVFDQENRQMLVGPGIADEDAVVITETVNLLNIFDTGRSIQQSYYGTYGPPYKPGKYKGEKWPWNPVQGGDQKVNSSPIVDFYKKDGELYVKCRPLDWALDNVATETYMEYYITLTDNIVEIDARFTDFSGYKHRVASQELPANYFVEPLRTFVAYSGTTPFENDQDLTVRNDLEEWWKDYAWHTTDTTEFWSAWVNEDQWGVATFTPSVTKHLAGRSGGDTFYRLTADIADPACYTAPVAMMKMRSYETFQYKSFLIIGYVDEMRNQIYDLMEEVDTSIIDSYIENR